MKKTIQKIYSRLFEKDEFQEMSNLFPKRTGLPFVIWLSHKSGKEGHWARVKVVIENNSYSVSVSDNPEWIQKPKGVSEKKLKDVIDWVKLNKQTLLDHWSGKTDSGDFVDAIKKL